MSMRWFRFYDEFVDDPKIAMMSESEQLLWVKALCLANNSKVRGVILLSDSEICWKLRISVEQWSSAMDKFRAKGMIEHCEGGYAIANWQKRQFASDDVTARTSAHKKKKKTERERSFSVPGNVLRTDTDTESESENIREERVTAHHATVDFSHQAESEQPTATEQEFQLTGKNKQPSLAGKTAVQVTSFPPAIRGENPQQGALIAARVQSPPSRVIEPSKAANRAEAIGQAVEVYNQYRGQWGECHGLSATQHNRLDLMLMNLTPDEFLAIIRDATLWIAQDKWLNRPDFDNKNFGFLIGRRGDDRLVEYAMKWRSLPESSKVGAAIKITQQKGQIQYHDLQGNPTKKTWAMSIWWEISARAIGGESVSQLEADWAKYYFPNYDIYTGDEWLA